MKSKLFLVAIVAAVALALYFVFRPGGIAQTAANSIHPLAAHAGTSSSNEVPLISGLLGTLSNIFRPTPGGGSATPIVGPVPVNSGVAQQIASFDSTYATPVVNQGPQLSFQQLQASNNPAPVIGGGASFDYVLGNPLTSSSDFASLVVPPDYSADTDTYGDILS